MINNIILRHTIITNISILTTVTIVCVTMLCPFMNLAFYSFYHLCDSGTLVTTVATAANHSDEEERYLNFLYVPGIC